MLLEEELGLINQRAAEEGLSLDPQKTELLHFSRKRHIKNPALRTPLGLDLSRITEVKGCLIGTPLRWLGLYLDRRLSFKHHAAQMAARAYKVTKGLQILGNTVRGAPPKLATQAVESCIQPILLYGAEAWWPGLTRGNRRGLETSNRVGIQAEKLQKVQNAAIRNALPTYLTTPTAALHREAGIQPITLALDHRVAMATLRARKLEPSHPLVERRLRERRYPTRYKTRLIRPSEALGTIKTWPTTQN